MFEGIDMKEKHRSATTNARKNINDKRRCHNSLSVSDRKIHLEITWALKRIWSQKQCDSNEMGTALRLISLGFSLCIVNFSSLGLKLPSFITLRGEKNKDVENLNIIHKIDIIFMYAFYTEQTANKPLQVHLKYAKQLSVY